MFIVYRAKSPTNKNYVGITKRGLKVRKQYHGYAVKNGSKGAFHNALRKYGDQVEWTILAEVETLEEANQLEQEWISRLNSFHPSGYNLTIGGDGVKGYQYTAEERARLSAARMGRKVPKEVGEKISATKKGRPDIKAQLDQVRPDPSGTKLSLERRRRISASLKGIKRPPRTAEHKKRLSESKSRYYVDQDGNTYKTLLDIAEVVNLHPATVGKKLKTTNIIGKLTLTIKLEN